VIGSIHDRRCAPDNSGISTPSYRPGWRRISEWGLIVAIRGKPVPDLRVSPAAFHGVIGAVSNMRGLLRVSFPVFLLFAHLAAAAEVDGIGMPAAENVSGARLALNGLAVRTYSLLRVRIYVAALYLAQRSSDANAILNSKQPKLLRFAFLRDVDAEAARKSWAEAFERSCSTPCQLPAEAIDRFLAAVPSVREGETSTLLFTDRGVDFLMNGRLLGRISDHEFARVILATFIGQHPTSDEVKAGLLGAPR
jgi:Chalcone isomerase-like